MARGLLVVFVLALFAAGPARATVLRFEAVIDQAWDPVFFLFPEEGTGSAATGIFQMDYDTETNIASGLYVSISGLAVADFVIAPFNRSHLHEPNGVARIIDVGSFGFVDVPGGVELNGGPAAVNQGFEADLVAGDTWINIHTLAFENGEVAGRLVPLPQCDDGIDNDQDGLIDLGDLGCFDEGSATEDPECSDGIDNGDLDLLADWDGAGVGPPDPQCVNKPWKRSENRCGLGFELVAVLLPLGWWRRRRSRRS